MTCAKELLHHQYNILANNIPTVPIKSTCVTIMFRDTKWIHIKNYFSHLILRRNTEDGSILLWSDEARNMLSNNRKVQTAITQIWEKVLIIGNNMLTNPTRVVDNNINSLHGGKRHLPPFAFKQWVKEVDILIPSASHLTLLFSLRKISCCPRTRSRFAKASDSIEKRSSEKSSVMILSWIIITLSLASVTKGEQSSVITEITDKKSKPEPEPNRSCSVGFRFWVSKLAPDRIEPNLSCYISPHPNSI